MRIWCQQQVWFWRMIVQQQRYDNIVYFQKHHHFYISHYFKGNFGWIKRFYNKRVEFILQINENVMKGYFETLIRQIKAIGRMKCAGFKHKNGNMCNLIRIRLRERDRKESGEREKCVWNVRKIRRKEGKNNIFREVNIKIWHKTDEMLCFTLCEVMFSMSWKINKIEFVGGLKMLG